MGTVLKFVLPSLLAYIIYRYATSKEVKVIVDEDGYFGTGVKKPDDPKIKPFKIDVPEEVLTDLKTRLKDARIGHSQLEDSNNFYYGFNVNHLQKLKEYWLTKYDWRKSEAIFNSFPNFVTQIEGLQVHFIHSKASPKYKKVYPALVVHGWPGNVFEFYKFIPILNDPKSHGINVDFAFDVVAPSIPGYGWSEQPKKTGFNQIAAARVFRKLMERVGYKKFYLQGGDWGSIITKLLAAAWPEKVLGLHLNLLPVTYHENFLALFHEIIGSYFPSLFFSPNQAPYNFFTKSKNILIESGYMHLQATKPDTIGTTLNDSPIGLAAYILEKFSVWTNYEDYKPLEDGGLNKKFTNDELLTIVMVYWVNQNIAASQRFYREFFLTWDIHILAGKYITVPTGHASGINEFFDRLPKEIGSHHFNLTHHSSIGMGHFAAFEAPKPLATSFFQFVGDLEKH